MTAPGWCVSYHITLPSCRVIGATTIKQTVVQPPYTLASLRLLSRLHTSSLVKGDVTHCVTIICTVTHAARCVGVIPYDNNAIHAHACACRVCSASHNMSCAISPS